jgi:hypothetical protein
MGMLPVARCVSRDDQLSQIRDIAELNKIIFNLDSLLIEELFRNTFSQIFMSGVTPEDLADVNVSGRKVITIRKPDVTITPTGADVGQAESIRSSISVYEKELYRSAGLRAPDVQQGPVESGRALKIRDQDFQQICCSIAQHAEACENYILDYWSRAMGIEIKHSVYPEEFQTEDIIMDLNITLDIIGSDLPRIIKNKKIIEFAHNYFPDMSDDDQRILRTQIEEGAREQGAVGEATTELG